MPSFVERIPIPKGTCQNRSLVIQVEDLVDQILTAKTIDQNTDTKELESQIDQVGLSAL